jgi:phytoene dehydrogenase-like protein
VKLDAVVVGAGPNGLSAAITLARAGRSVHLIEANDTVGGGVRSAALTLPGFLHDVCSSVYPLASTSPFFGTLPLDRHGLGWARAEIPLAHPLDGGGAVVLARDLADTARALGEDGPAYHDLFARPAQDWDAMASGVLSPLSAVPRHPFALARFGLRAIRSAQGLAGRFRSERARALFAGLAAHAFVPPQLAATGGFALVLGASAHASGWPFVRGGAQRLADALAAILGAHGGTLEVGRRVRSLAELPDARAVLLDVTPRQLLALAGDRLPRHYRAALARFRYGPGAFKIDYALDGPIPWTAEPCRRAAVVHVGGTAGEVSSALGEAWAGIVPRRPFVLVAQPTLADPARAPAGKHVAWAYCHVPNGTDADMTDRLEDQIERFAPGFRARILARSVRGPAALEAANANLVGGDITGGAQDLRQLLARPAARIDPYATPLPGLFLCSASTPPGGGVHGMCGFLAARSALAWLRRSTVPGPRPAPGRGDDDQRERHDRGAASPGPPPR